MHRPAQVMAWNEAPPPLIGFLAAALLAGAAIALDTVLANAAGQPGVVLDWFPLAAAGLAFLAAFASAGAVRQAALTATIVFLAMFPALNPDPQAWMYAAPPTAVALALGIALTPTTRAIVALPALCGLLAMLERLPDASSATLFGALAIGAYLGALWLELPTLALPTLKVDGVGAEGHDAREHA